MASGGSARGTVVDSGGTLELLDGANVSGTAINPGGTLEIAAGYVLSNYVVDSGTTLDVASGGTAVSPIVSSGGIAVVGFDGMADNATVDDGGVLTIYGTVNGLTNAIGSTVAISGAGALDVLSGDTVNGVAADGGYEEVRGGRRHRQQKTVDQGGEDYIEFRRRRAGYRHHRLERRL